MDFSHPLISWFTLVFMTKVKWISSLHPGCSNAELSFLRYLTALVCLSDTGHLIRTALHLQWPRLFVPSDSGWQRQTGFTLKRSRMEERPCRRAPLKHKERCSRQILATEALFCGASLQISWRGLDGSQLSRSTDDSPDSPLCCALSLLFGSER